MKCRLQDKTILDISLYLYMKYSINLRISCLVCLGLVQFILSCSQQQESDEFILSIPVEQEKIYNDFIPYYFSDIPEIELPLGIYNNYPVKDFIINGAVDSLNKKSGKWKICLKKSDLIFQGTYFKNEKEKWWYVLSAGKLFFCGNFIHNRKTGFWRYFTDSTQIYVSYDNDTLTDFARKYTSDSVLLSEGYYEKGLKSGYWKFYYQSGVLKEQGDYHDGLKSGWWQTFDENAKLIEEASYSRGELSGYFKKYIHGVISAEGKQFNGRKRGAWKYYHESGEINRIQQYDE